MNAFHSKVRVAQLGPSVATSEHRAQRGFQVFLDPGRLASVPVACRSSHRSVDWHDRSSPVSGRIASRGLLHGATPKEAEEEVQWKKVE